MEIVQLLEITQELIGDRSIICFEKSVTYLQELSLRYPDIYAKVSFIVDFNPRYQSALSVENRIFDVKGKEFIEKYDPRDAAILITSDYYLEAYEILKHFFEDKINVPDRVFFFANYETEIELSYRNRYKNDPLKDIIVFRSGPHSSSYVKGLDFADNARALYECALSMGLNRKYELVWIVNDSSEFTSPSGRYYRYYRDYDNLTFVSFGDSVTEDIEKRDEYYRVLCLAKWIFMTDAYGFCRNARTDQIRVQLWHGCGFKTRTNFVPCEKRYEYNTVISEKYRSIHADIYGLRDDQVIITGYPKCDYLFHPVDQSVAKNLNLERDNETQKIVFWLPTFRQAKSSLSELNEKTKTSTGLPLIESMDEIKALDEKLLQNNIKLVIKLHPFQDRHTIADITKEGKLSNIALLDNEQLVDEDVQIGQVLAYSDALISDYSSVAIEYLLLDKPIAFTLDDIEDYENSRGFVFDNVKEWLPGKELYNIEDFLRFVDEIGKSQDLLQEKRHRITNILHQYKDDKSSERVIKMLGII